MYVYILYNIYKSDVLKNSTPQKKGQQKCFLIFNLPQALFLHGLLEGMARIEVPNCPFGTWLGLGGPGSTNLGGCFQKWWYPTTMGFPTKKDHFGVFWGYHHLRKHPNLGGGNSHIFFGIFTPYVGEMIQFDYSVFFQWVETTNEIYTHRRLI